MNNRRILALSFEPPTLRRWSVLLLIAALCLGLAIGGESVRVWARYEREAVEMGQLWRLLSAHLVHLGWSHLAMNLIALGLLGAVFDDVVTPGEWAVTSVAAAATIDLGLYLLDNQVQWYVGLSGVLHGLLAFGALKLVRRGSGIGAILAAGLIGKLAWEHWVGPIAFSEASAGGAVIVAAHLYGTVAGIVTAAVIAAVRRRAGRQL